MSEPNQTESFEPGSSSWLVHQWVVAGIVASATRFIPVPFVDDVVRNQCRRFVVERTLSVHNASDSVAQWKPYYSSGGGCVSGCLGALAKAPLKLLLFPIRKIFAVMTSIRGVPLEIVRTVLLGRTLDRVLRHEPLSDELSPAPPSRLTARDAELMRVAFEETFARMDFQVVHAAMSDALRGVRGWKASAIASAKRVAETKDGDDKELPADEAVESGASRVQAVLDRPATLELFAEFDRRFDAAIGRLTV